MQLLTMYNVTKANIFLLCRPMMSLISCVRIPCIKIVSQIITIVIPGS